MQCCEKATDETTIVNTSIMNGGNILSLPLERTVQFCKFVLLITAEICKDMHERKATRFIIMGVIINKYKK